MTSTIPQLRSAISRGDTSHEAVVARALEGAALPAARHVFTRLYAEPAMEAARHADRLLALGQPLAPLGGLPVSVKDLFDVAGSPTAAGSRLHANAKPADADAAVVSRLRAQGAALIGRTNMTEFAFSGVGINPHYGTPRNPADPIVARIPGGSSSGAAVSVALGLAVAGIGSDTGGSIRVPAALCGLVGFKNSQSRVSRAGAFELSRTLDTACAMTRSVSDCLTVDAALSGEQLPVRRRTLAGIRLALPQTMMFDGIEPEVSRAFERSVQRLSAAGAIIDTIAFSELGEISALNAPGGFSAVEAYAVHRRDIEQHREAYDPRVAKRILGGAVASAADYLTMQDARRDWIRRAEAVLQPYDALICPTVSILAPEIQTLVDSEDAFFKANGLLLRNTFAINFLDGCAFSLPCHRPGELPVGLMLSAVNGDDARLAAVALAVEVALAD